MLCSAAPPAAGYVALELVSTATYWMTAKRKGKGLWLAGLSTGTQNKTQKESAFHPELVVDNVWPSFVIHLQNTLTGNKYLDTFHTVFCYFMYLQCIYPLRINTHKVCRSILFPVEAKEVWTEPENLHQCLPLPCHREDPDWVHHCMLWQITSLLQSCCW